MSGAAVADRRQLAAAGQRVGPRLPPSALPVIQLQFDRAAMADADAPGRILLVGAPGVSTLPLLGAITGQPTPSPDQRHPWSIDNKYYRAEVQLEVRQVDQCEGLQLAAAGYEAVVLAFDAAHQPSFDSVQRWYEGAAGDDADLGVKLAVAMRPGGSGHASPPWLQRAEEWCAEQLVEYVEWGAADAPEPEGPAAAREGATGVRRIHEALEAHMWPGMQLKPAPQRGAAAAAAAAAQGEAAGVEGAAPQPAANGLSNGAAAPAVAAAAAAPDFSFSQYLQAPDQAVAAAAAAAGGGPGEEAEVEQLEQLFAQMQSERPPACRPAGLPALLLGRMSVKRGSYHGFVCPAEACLTHAATLLQATARSWRSCRTRSGARRRRPW